MAVSAKMAIRGPKVYHCPVGARLTSEIYTAQRQAQRLKIHSKSIYKNNKKKKRKGGRHYLDEGDDEEVEVGEAHELLEDELGDEGEPGVLGRHDLVGDELGGVLLPLRVVHLDVPHRWRSLGLAEPRHEGLLQQRPTGEGNGGEMVKERGKVSLGFLE